MKNMGYTGAALLGLKRALDDPEVSEAVKEIEGDLPLDTAFNLINGLENEDAAFRRIKHYYLNETSRRHAEQKDLGFRHFTEDERQLLGMGPEGKARLALMRDGDQEAVQQAKLLLKEIKLERERLGLS